MKFMVALFRFAVHFGFLGLLVVGVLDSSFLAFPFGNDLMVVVLAARRHQSAPWYALAAALGSTLGVLLLALVSRKLGVKGLRRIAGEARFEKLKSLIENRGEVAVAIAALAPAPFPNKLVIAAVSAIDYPIWRTVAINFFARGLRFGVLAVLAIRFGRAILTMVKSPSFKWGMIVFIAICLVASGFSIWRWMRMPREPNG